MSHRSFKSFGEFLGAVVNVETVPSRDPRLIFEAVTGLGESVGEHGGFLIPTEFASQLWDRTYDSGQFLAMCTRQPVTIGNTLKVPAISEASRADGSRLGGTTFYWAAEAESAQASKPRLAQITLNLNKLFGLTVVTEELMRDAPALVAVLQRVFGLESAHEVEDEIVAGDGVGKPLGVRNAPATVIVDEAVDPSTDAVQGAATVIPENTCEMWRRLWAPSRRHAIWLCNPDIDLELFNFRGGEDGKAPLFSWGGDGRPLLCGRPIIPHESCSPVGQKGDLILMDPSQYLVAERNPEFISSVHVRFLEQEGAFRFTWRIDGQPAWATPVMPKNGSDLVSPYVALGERDGTG